MKTKTKTIKLISRRELLEAYDRLVGKERAARDIAKRGFTLQCPNPECGNRNIESMQSYEEVPEYSPIKLDEDVLVVYRSARASYPGCASKYSLICELCNEQWKIPTNAKVRVR